MRGTTTSFPTYTQYTHQQVLAAYQQAPARLRRAIEGLDEATLRLRPRGESTWSIQEIVMHVTDSEVQGVFRIRKAWSESGTALPGYNEALWTKELNHQEASPAERTAALELFSALRVATYPLLAGASERDLDERAGVHPEYGRLTVRNLLELYADHGERHLEQILTIRALLGKQLPMPMLLRERLY
jgi:uncharacterized damage-inducible protein DinB